LYQNFRHPETLCSQPAILSSIYLAQFDLQYFFFCLIVIASKIDRQQLDFKKKCYRREQCSQISLNLVDFTNSFVITLKPDWSCRPFPSGKFSGFVAVLLRRFTFFSFFV
jgi:hypothetical protein